MSEEKANVIRDERTENIYFDNGIIRNFETVLMKNVTLKTAKKEYPNIIKI